MKMGDRVLYNGSLTRIVGRAYGSFDIETRAIIFHEGRTIIVEMRRLTPVAADAAETDAGDAKTHDDQEKKL